MTKFTKDDIVRKVNKKIDSKGLSIDMTRRVLNTLLDVITDIVSGGDAVEFTGFGTFKQVKCASKNAHNMATQERIVIPERYLPKFKVGSIFKKAATKNVA